MKIVLRCYKKFNFFHIWPKNPCVCITYFQYFIHMQNKQKEKKPIGDYSQPHVVTSIEYLDILKKKTTTWLFPMTCCEIYCLYKKRVVLQLGLQFNFWIAMTICNSLQLNCNSITTTSFQLLWNSPMTTTIMLC
jgi:hypothetical protein